MIVYAFWFIYFMHFSRHQRQQIQHFRQHLAHGFSLPLHLKHTITMCVQQSGLQVRNVRNGTWHRRRIYLRHTYYEPSQKFNSPIKADRLLTRDTLNTPWLLTNRQFQWTGNGHSQLSLAELGKPSPNIDLLCTTGSNKRAPKTNGQTHTRTLPNVLSPLLRGR